MGDPGSKGMIQQRQERLQTWSPGLHASLCGAGAGRQVGFLSLFFRLCVIRGIEVCTRPESVPGWKGDWGGIQTEKT